MSRSGSFGAIPAGAERRRRRLSSVMVADCPRAQRRDWKSCQSLLVVSRSGGQPTIPRRYGLLCFPALLFRCAAVHSPRGVRSTDPTFPLDTTRTFRSELRKALQNTGLSILRQSQFVDTRRYPRLYLVVPVENG